MNARTTPRRALENISALLIVGAFIGSAAYSIWAMFAPYAEPAASFIDWQARWGDGRYGLKATFLATWLNIMLAGGVVFSIGWVPYYLISWARSPRAPMPSGPEWRALPTTALRNSALGVALGLAPAVAIYSALLADAESLSFLGGACTLVFLLGPIAAAIGIVSLLNLALPRRVIVATVDALKQTHDNKGNVLSHTATIAGQEWNLTAEAWRQLQVGLTVALRAPSVNNAPLALFVRSSPHFR